MATSVQNQSNLGHKVTTRELNWLDLCMRAWGTEWSAPDHGIYEFSYGRKFDSTDRGITGIYNPNNNQGLMLDGGKYPDMASYLLNESSPAVPQQPRTQIDQN